MKKTKILQRCGLICLVLTLVITAVKAGALLEPSWGNIFTSSEHSAGAAGEQFDTYLDDLFCQEVAASTINLHYTLKNPENFGITDYPVTYGEISRESQEESIAVLENIQAALKGFHEKNLTTDQRMTYDMLQDYVTQELSASDFYLYQEMLRPSTGTQAELPVLMAEYTFYGEKDVQDYLSLLQQTPEYFRQILLFELEKANQGLFMSEFAAGDIIQQCENFVKDKENNYLLDTFDDKIEAMADLTVEQKEQYKAENETAVREQVIPAYEMMIQGLKKLAAAGKNQQGLYHLEQGKEYYEYLVKSYTGSEMTIEEMQEETRKQRAKDMTQAARLLADNPNLITECTTYVFAEQDPTVILTELQEKMTADFPAPPDTAFTVKYVHPSLEEFMAPAFYLTVPIDDISQNSIYINDSNHYQKLKLYTTLAHEGFPGHLYQNIMERSQNLSPMRSLLGTSGYAEGWATYVEMLSYQYADVDSALAGLLQKDQSALLSLYATADMGIHYEGWSLDQLLDFFGEYQITDRDTITEIYHLIVEEPAHYLKYYIGYLEFLNLKEYAQDLYGDGYSDYKFHEALMKMGPAQFSILKEYLPEYYNKAE